MNSLVKSIFKSSRPYVKPELEYNIINYKYVGTCENPIYTYIQSPLCDATVKQLPMWLAPNVITLVAFLCQVVPHFFMIALFGHELEGPLDGWFCIILGIAYFMYNFLDNCDGKQARRTGTGSPMGMLFDHGLDSATCFFAILPLMRMFQIGPGFPSLLCAYLTTFQGYYIFVEEHWIGRLILPKYCGPDDIAMLVWVLCFLSAYYGSEQMWTGEFDIGFGTTRISFLFILGFFVFNVINVTLQITTNIYSIRHSKAFLQKYDYKTFFSHLLYLPLLMGIYYTYTQLTGSRITIDYPKLVILSYGAEFLQATLRTQISTVVHDKPQVFRKTTFVSWSLLTINGTSMIVYGAPLINELWMMLFICLMCWSSIIHYVYYVLEDFKRVLGIKIFTITPKLSPSEEKNSRKPAAKDYTLNKKEQ